MARKTITLVLVTEKSHTNQGKTLSHRKKNNNTLKNTKQIEGKDEIYRQKN